MGKLLTFAVWDAQMAGGTRNRWGKLPNWDTVTTDKFAIAKPGVTSRPALKPRIAFDKVTPHAAVVTSKGWVQVAPAATFLSGAALAKKTFSAPFAAPKVPHRLMGLSFIYANL